MPAVVFEDRGLVEVDALVESDALWLAPAELARATGWELRPEGICRGDLCVALPRGHEREMLREDGGLLDLVAFARLRGQPVVRDAEVGAWAFGHPPAPKPPVGDLPEAPDFTLPDLDGRPHTLSGLRGTKVLLLSWASW